MKTHRVHWDNVHTQKRRVQENLRLKHNKKVVQKDHLRRIMEMRQKMKDLSHSQRGKCQ
jgi:hypothetical protein